MGVEVGDLRRVEAGVGEGDLLTVTVTYKVPGVSVLAGLVSHLPLVGFDLSGLANVSGSSTARRE